MGHLFTANCYILPQVEKFHPGFLRAPLPLALVATHSSVPAWRIPGTAGPGGLLSMQSHRVGHDLAAAAAAAAAVVVEGIES